MKSLVPNRRTPSTSKILVILRITHSRTCPLYPAEIVGRIGEAYTDRHSVYGMPIPYTEWTPRCEYTLKALLLVCKPARLTSGVRALGVFTSDQDLAEHLRQVLTFVSSCQVLTYAECGIRYQDLTGPESGADDFQELFSS
jgi:hypothetical protein